jgi:hypothetical protein
MGGSGYTIGNGGSAGGTPTNKCGEKVIILLIVNQNQSEVWEEIRVGDEVSITVNNSGTLPIMEVNKSIDNFRVGIVPPNYGWLLNCIEGGWNYHGAVITKEGSQHDPKITVALNGVM